MFKLSKKIAVVTGASRGIGKAMAETYAQADAHVICVSRNEDALNGVADLIRSNGGSASVAACNVSDLENFQKLIKDTVDNYGSVDILVNNAGITRDTLIMRMSEDDWDTVIDINLKGAFNGIKAVTRTMMKQKSGRIINISSVVGLTGNAGQVNYAASKAGLIGLTKSAAKEIGSRGITVNCIAPGYIATDMTDQLDDQAKDLLISQIPLGRIGSPDDIAATALFLASDEAGYITGQTFTVDGGMVMI
ncbi:MAG: 3-oxoacyl-[acyl-carrier-protein] reductase [Candidatus Marinimicrobia bacterium]|nr:3-oxoacyl-[acyl-carrier-protein] reductase [Candidatus Neomarinimicrobiota bacterium]MBT3947492.1 3-oxoacyl-[acyl-carrier-protein] reductase [Candidatus Neomarinimicrobiota bacterium]MBT5995360.1 3-oxoacyl-[acyl-carrier-protein] reductase [Candidatus Neomarinimicrobiota bacterium]MBT6941985.1 3-oxoacyl-[acyl-carrier-protein] reductase [Candidatus Neomarinimicrobiota bacterium]MBT7083442.1 3-oxoacyl-[acyl-carrier-protein] reductase [Candidatus Neomarinimicrobiota bacterium]